MASMIVSALTNAASFVGMNFLFKQLDKEGYSAETKRHNEAMEKLNDGKEEWFERNSERKNKIEKRRRALDNANASINSTNKAFSLLAVVLERQIAELKLEEKPEPTLADFYEPSDERKEYERLGAGVVGVVGGFAGYEAYKYFWKAKRK